MSGLKLLVSDNAGIFVPRRFFEDYNCEVWGIDPDGYDADTIWSGPDANDYWDCWDAVLSRACHKDMHGNVWTLHEDGDLWAICVDLMDDEEYENFFGEARKTV